jgi:membrane fusion protein, multidrug efflux system
MLKLVRLIVTLLLGGVVTAGVWKVWREPAAVQKSQGQGRRGGGGPGGDGPVPVRAVAALTADVPVTLDAVGTARALNTVSVQPQTSGKVLKVNFKEGQNVEKGQVLAEIDPAPLQAILDQAIAKQRQDAAQLANARVDLERYNRIPGTLPQKTVDTQRALVTQLEGLAASNKASVDAANLNLAYTKIIAPVSGRTGLRQVDEGNIVAAGGTSAIVTITQVKPIAVLFNIPQQQLSQVNKAVARGVVTVEALEADNKTVIDKGVLQVVDNQVDQTTGTVRMKAEFPNGELQQWPGQFVNIRLLADTLKNSVVVPTAAVQRGPQGSFVYVVGTDESVTVRPVTIAQQDDTRAVVAAGLIATEQVVTTGFARLKDGAKVAVALGDGSTPAAAPGSDASLPPGAGKGRRRDGGEGKPGDGKPGDTKPADGKPGEPRKWDGQPRADGQPRGEGRRRREQQDGTAGAAPAAGAAAAPAKTGIADTQPGTKPASVPQ